MSSLVIRDFKKCCLVSKSSSLLLLWNSGKHRPWSFHGFRMNGMPKYFQQGRTYVRPPYRNIKQPKHQKILSPALIMCFHIYFACQPLLVIVICGGIGRHSAEQVCFCLVRQLFYFWKSEFANSITKRLLKYTRIFKRLT